MFGEQLRNIHTVVGHTIFWTKPSGNISKKEPQVAAAQGKVWMFRGSTACARPSFEPSGGMVLHPSMAATEKFLRVLCLTLVQMNCCFHAAKCVTVMPDLRCKCFVHHQFLSPQHWDLLGMCIAFQFASCLFVLSHSTDTLCYVSRAAVVFM